MAIGTTRTEKWGRWVGTPDDVAAIAELALAEVTRRRADGEQVECRIAVGLPGIDHEFDSPQEFVDEIRAPDLAAITTVTVRVGDTWRSGPLAVTITWTDYSGVSLTVAGNDRAVVVGAAQVLSDRLKEGGRKRAVEPFLFALGSVCLAVSLSFLVGLVRLRDENDPKGTDPVVVAVFLGWLLCGAGGHFLARWCFPRLELVQPGQPSRWIRARKLVLGVILFIAAAVAGVAADRLI